MCDGWTREVEDVGTSEQARNTTKKAPRPTATAGAKEIKVPYLFDEPFDTALPSATASCYSTCSVVQTRSTA